MRTFGDSEAWIRKEIVAGPTLERGARGGEVERLQQLLTLASFSTHPDGVFGPATETCVRDFQRRVQRTPTGVVTKALWEKLTVPLAMACRPLAPRLGLRHAVVRAARQHLHMGAREVGKAANMGPFVRLYMQGHDGPDYLWCAGFVSFVYKQAYYPMGIENPLGYHWSCDRLAEEGIEAKRFVEGKEAGDIPPGSIFLIRRKGTRDWFHTGLVTETEGKVVRTIEGNSNADGGREGHAVVARTRKKRGLDFITLPDLGRPDRHVST